MLRRELPVYSPLPLRALARGAAALLGFRRGAGERLSRAFRATHDARQVMLTDSGTSALTLALRAALLERPGLPAALPAYCCYDLVTAANGAGAPVVLYDIDPATLGPDFDSLRAATAGGVAAIVVAHLYGIPVDLAAAARIAAERGAVLIEDAAQGAGASYGGRPLGSFGSLSVLSFGRGKGITAGRGGALLAHDERGQRLLQSVRGQVLPRRAGLAELVALGAQWLLGRPALYGIPASIPWLGLGETVYRDPRPPRAMSRVAAAVLEVTLPLQPAEADTRRASATRLLEGAKAAGVGTVRVPEGAGPGYLRLPVVLAPGARRGADARLGIMPGYPLTLAALNRFGGEWLNRGTDFPGAKMLTERLVTLPVHGRVGVQERTWEAWLGK